MTTLLAPDDVLSESQRLLAALTHLDAELPFAHEMIAAHKPVHLEIQRTHEQSEQAVSLWRGALARRWECEVSGRRLYKRILRKMVDFYGSEHAPEVQLLSRSGAEANSSPSELLADLRRLHAALDVGSAPFYDFRLQTQIEQECAALQQAIAETNTHENERRNAVLDHRMAREAYRRLRSETLRRLQMHYGDQFASTVGDLFSEE
jgi:hypothetical protein